MRFNFGSYVIQPQTLPPPISHADLEGQVVAPRSLPLSSGYGGLKSAPISTSLSGPVEYAVHCTCPSPVSSDFSQPRTPSSPPLTPTSTWFFTTSGAIVMVSPWLISPTLVFQTCLPVFASTAMVWSSSVLKKILPSE